MGALLPADNLRRLLKQREGPTLEFKRSTGELREGLQTVCAFLNGTGGQVLFGVRPDGQADGQQVSDQTLREIAEAAERFEPPAGLSVQRAKVKSGREVVVLAVDRPVDSGPFTYEGRPYERVSATTRRMPQARYEKLLLDRAHGTRRWENAPAEGVELRHLDRDEVYRIVEAARSTGRLVGPIGSRVADVLDRLAVRRDGQILQAAVVLFGKTFLPDYPQCELRMARFRGLDKTEFLDQRQVRGPAFKLLEEAELFCQRHFPLPGKIVPGKLQRVDIPLIPPDAMREILVNALIHRDYSIAGGAVFLAIYDDRVEVASTGTFPTGIRPEMLSREHPSVLRNPIIAEVFFRAGLIEKWGRGTNRVIAMCRAAGVRPPEFAESAGAATVTFRVPVGQTVKPHETPHEAPREEAHEEAHEAHVKAHVRLAASEAALLAACSQEPRGTRDLLESLGYADRTGNFKRGLKRLMALGFLKMVVPDRPRSRLQRYMTTETGRRALQGAKKDVR